MKREELKKTKRYLAYKDSTVFWNIPKAWCVRFDLTPTELLIFAEIHQATHHWGNNCYCASRTSLAVIVNSTLPTVDKALINLLDKGFIVKATAQFFTRQGGERRQIAYRSTLPAKIAGNDKSIEKLLENAAAPREINGEMGKK